MNPATRTTPANSVSFLAKFSTTAAATAVPRLCPIITIRSGGIFANSRAHFTVVIPSMIRPSSVGEPVEYPKPR
jgi:hypothetical protein